MKLDILVFAAHPDDAELACSGTILKHVAEGKRVGIVDFTQGEMGTRGTPELRLEEADRSSKILGLTVRENLGFKDCFFEDDKAHITKLAEMIRKYQPEILLANSLEDRHPDHGRAGHMAQKAVFWAGLRKLEADYEPWRPSKVYHYIQDRFIKPDFVVDVTPYWDAKLESIKAFSSQFYDPKSDEPESYISSKQFWQFIEARGREYGHFINKELGEGFTSLNPIELNNLL